MTMVVDFVLDTAFEALRDGIKDLIEKNIIFKSLLKNAKSRLDDLAPLIKKLAQYNKEMDGREKELEALKGIVVEGQELVDKCSTITRWSPFKKFKYARKLLDWEESLKSPLEGVKLQEAINIMDIRLEMQRQKPSSTSSTRLELPLLPRHIVGLDAPLKDLKAKFLGDDGVSMLVLTAPGGCGKTTLATMFCQDEDVKGKFKNNIIFITVSQDGTLERVLKQLGEYVGFPVPILGFECDQHIFQWMQTFRKERPNPLLVVLDDVWSGSEYILESLHRFDISSYKILVTSRSEFPRFSCSYQLKLLDEKNSMKLFYHSTSLGGKCSRTLEDLSRKIVKRCNGFPLAITVVGRSLSGQPLEVWRTRESKWSKDSSILDSETTLLFCLQSSIDALNKGFTMVKDCYLDLGSFHEDREIPIDDLIDIWAGLYDLDEDSVIANLHELGNRNLATLVDKRSWKMNMEGDDYYGERFVTQHDLLRELAIYNAKLDPVEQRKKMIIDLRGNNIPKWWKEQRFQLTQTRLLSITTGWSRPLKEWPDMHLPEAEVFVLNFSYQYGYTIPEFVGKMDKLKVLVVVGQSHMSWLENVHLLELLPNLTRISLHNISVNCLIKNALQLKSVKKLSLESCTWIHYVLEKQVLPLWSLWLLETRPIMFLGKLLLWLLGFPTPVERVYNISDAFPNLEELNLNNSLESIDMLAEFCGVISLKKISIVGCAPVYGLPKQIGNLVNLEVLRLRGCPNFSKFPGSVRNLKRLTFLDISSCMSLKYLPQDIGKLSSLRKVDMRHCGVKKLPSSVRDLDQLEEVICSEDGALLWEPFKSTLTNLRVVVIP